MALVVAAGCTNSGPGDGDTAAGSSTTLVPRSIVDRRPFPVERLEVAYEDGERGRALPVVVHHPDGAGRFPFVVLSHGLSADGPFVTPIAERLARSGYVVVAPTYPKTSRGRSNLLDVRNQPADVSFVLDAVLSDPRFSSLVDADLIATGGHSLGGVTSLMVGFHSCCADDRLDAVFAYAGAAFLAPSGDWFEEPGAPPLLMLHGDSDDLVLFPLGRDAFERAAEPKHFVRLLNAEHTPPYVSEQPYFDVVIEATVAFLDAYVLDDDDALDRLRIVSEADGVSKYEEAA